MMLKLTIVGRVSDGLPLSQGPRYVNEEDDDSVSAYKQQGEFLLKEISRGALPNSKMTIFLDHHCFNYMVENGICFMAFCDSMYPRKLVFHYLQDLQKEFKKFDVGVTENYETV
ncbi:UNVERIFIED_CONTAM: vesicle transport protein [Sesamum radiatum]|uniref:Vesicle transport protein n=1 Tax=Sesamum radiatum TaxID=300843 RepID=A0AAW2KCX0_SESRA